MKGTNFVTVVAVLIVVETRCGGSQPDFAPIRLSPPRECPNGTPVAAEGTVCNETSICIASSKTSNPVACHCDDQCLSFGDCCINAPIRTKLLNGVAHDDAESVSPRTDIQYEECQPVQNGLKGYYMISRCPETFQDDFTRKSCEEDPDPKDYFMLTPVSDVTKGRLFRNFYCALCHKTPLKDLYFWLHHVDCYEPKVGDTSSKDEPTAMPDERDTGIDYGTSVSEDDDPFVDDGTSVSEEDNVAIDDGTSVSEDDNPHIDDGTSVSEAIDVGTSVSEEDNVAIDDGTSVSEDDNPHIDDGTSVSEAIDDGTSVSEDDNEAIDDGTSVSEGDSKAIDDGTSVSEDDGAAVDDGTSVSQNNDGVTDDGTSFSEDDYVETGTSVSKHNNEAADDNSYVFEDNPPTQSPVVLRLLTSLNASHCRRKFEYRYQNPNPHRQCMVVHVDYYVNDNSQKVPCPSYVDPYVSESGVIYKNRDCASCNRENVALSQCASSSKYRPSEVQSFSKLFLLVDGYKTSITGKVIPSMCEQSEVYDPYSNLCRPFVRYDEPRELSSKPSDSLEVTGEFYLGNTGCLSNPSHDNICQENINDIVRLSFESLVTSFLPNFDGRLENISTSCYPHKHLFICKEESFDGFTCTFRGYLESEHLDDVRALEPELIGPLLDANYRNHGCASELTIDIQKIFITLTDSSESCDDSPGSNRTGIAFTWETEENTTDVAFTVQTCSSEIPCTWSLTLFKMSEYVFDGSDVILKNKNLQLNVDQYRKMGNGSIAACVNLEQEWKDIKIRERQKNVQKILTILGGSLSLVCLTATVLTYLIFPRLRNNVGKAILSLVLCLLVAQSFQLVLWDKTKNKTFCTVIAIISHYSFLAAFFWMNILSFDLSRTFGTRAKMQTVRDSRKLFFFYSLYGWFSPLLIVGACIAIHFSDFEKLNTENEWVPLLQYGSHQLCWIFDHVALTYAFGVPIAVLLLCNAFFLADTVFGIFSAKAATRRATHTNPQLLRRDGKKDFLLFCKLSCIMGISWLFGFVAGYTDMQVFHVIFILLNSTQGVFIFLAFVCNPRVIEMWRLKYSKQKLTSVKSNSYSATAKTSVNSISCHQVNQVRFTRDHRFDPVQL